jgi:threonine/homoserine efflux transporter RhtA
LSYNRGAIPEGGSVRVEFKVKMALAILLGRRASNDVAAQLALRPEWIVAGKAIAK